MIRIPIPVLALLLYWSRAVGAQSAPATDKTEHGRLFQARDAIVGLGVVAAAAAAMSIDQRVAEHFQRPSVQSNRTLRGATNAFNNVGFPGTPIISAGFYFLGLEQHSRPVAALGMHTGEAIVLAGVLSEALGMTIGRARPLHNLTNPHDFQFGKGFSDDDYTSLPSAHVTVAFAAATAISEEVGQSWPRAEKFVAPVSYSLAGLVGVARMYRNKHWASDVVASSGLGIYSGVLFERYNRYRPNNIFNRIFLPASIVPSRKGASVVWTVGTD